MAFANPAIDPIRPKIAINIRDTTLRMQNDGAYATDKEWIALETWLKAREDCISASAAKRRATTPAQILSVQISVEQRTNQLIGDLRGGKISYGQFNTARVGNVTEGSKQIAQIKRDLNIGPQSSSATETRVPLKNNHGTFSVPVIVNNAIRLDFIIDSGAADVSIPADVVITLMRTGTLKSTDFTGKTIYVLADGSKVPSSTFVIRSLKVGNKIITDVRGNVASVKGSLLLGQSFLQRIKSWSIDNSTQQLVLQ